MKNRILLAILVASGLTAARVQAENAPLPEITAVVTSMTRANAVQQASQFSQAQLYLWQRPGIPILPGKIVPLGQRQVEIPGLLRGIKSGALKVLKDKAAHDYPKDSCEHPSSWDGIWFVYPGDWMLDSFKKNGGNCVAGSDAKLCQNFLDHPATWTLIYHHQAEKIPLPKDKTVVDPFGNPIERMIDPHAGENYYFGLIEEAGQLKLHSYFSDVDCDV